MIRYYLLRYLPQIILTLGILLQVPSLIKTKGRDTGAWVLIGVLGIMLFLLVADLGEFSWNPDRRR